MFVPPKDLRKRLEEERGAARAGYRKAGAARTWEERAPPDEDYDRLARDLERTGLRAVVRLWISGNSDWPENPIIGLEVRPLRGENTLMHRAPNFGTPWRISIGFAKNPPTEEQVAFAEHYRRPRVVNLQIKRINYTGYAELDTERDPIATDPIVQAVHRNSFYKDRPLHISL